MSGPAMLRTVLAAALLAAAASLPVACTDGGPPNPALYVGPAWRPVERGGPAGPNATPTSAPTSAPTAPSLLAPATGPAAAPPAASVPLTVQEAILQSLAHNQALAVERLSPLISRTFEQEERAAFDPVLAGEASGARTKSQRLGRAGAGTEGSIADSAALSASAGAHLPTGTDLAIAASTGLVDSSLYSDRFQTTRVGLTVTQALLRGASLRANLASLRQARLDSLASQYELRGFAEALMAEVEAAYWDYALAEREIEIYRDSLTVADKQLAETEERIRLGGLAETELAAAQAEVALRREGLITARGDLAGRRLRLLRLLNWPAEDLWRRKIALACRPVVPEVQLDDVEQHVQVALRMRPDLNQARLLVQRDELEIVKTKDGLLPKLDLFMTLGKSGYAENFRRSVGDMPGDAHDLVVGLRVEQPPLNRQARAAHQRAVLSRSQSAEAVRNLEQLAQVDVRTAFVDVERYREQIDATATTRQFQAEKLRAETEKLRVGKSTSLLVAAAQRDLLASQIAEIRAIANYLKALVHLHRLEGSLLERRGIAAPGREPASMDGPPDGRP